MGFKEKIKRHLDKMAEQDAAFAERYALKSKNLDSCCDYIRTQAKKQAEAGCACIEDSIVYGWAVHYYQEDDVKVENVKAKVVSSKEKTTPATKPAEIKPIKALVKDKKNKTKCVELDMFASMF